MRASMGHLGKLANWGLVLPRCQTWILDRPRAFEAGHSPSNRSCLDRSFQYFLWNVLWQTRAWNSCFRLLRLITCVVSSEYIFCSKFLMHDSKNVLGRHTGASKNPHIRSRQEQLHLFLETYILRYKPYLDHLNSTVRVFFFM
jgi:hypothetical protein